MDALKQLHTSVAQAFENCFDNAYRDLKAQLAIYETRVRDAEKRAEAADEARQKAASELGEVRQENSLLREALKKANNPKANGFISKPSQLEELYVPCRVFNNSNLSSISAESLKTIHDRYVELYEQFCSLQEMMVNLRGLVKRHKTKLVNIIAKFEEKFMQQEFTTTVGGRLVKFQRVVSKGENKESSPQGSAPRTTTRTQAVHCGLEATAPFQIPLALVPEENQDQIGISTGAESDDKSRRILQIENLESAFSPSESSDDLPPIFTPASSSRAEENVPVEETLKRKCPAFDQPVSSRSLRNGPAHPIMIKSESLSSSPLRTFSSDRGPAGTQDLDDIGDTIVTPTKKIRFYKDPEPHAHGEFSGGNESSSPHRRDYGSAGSQPTSRVSRVLRPVGSNSRNVGIGPISSNGWAKELGSISRISSVTEDGVENRAHFLEKDRKPQDGSTLRYPPSEHRLLDLLEKSSPKKRVALVKGSIGAPTPPQNRTGRSSKGSSLMWRTGAEDMPTIPPRTSDPSRTNLEPVVRGRAVGESAHQPESMSQMVMAPDDEPFRARPLHRLGLEHFKINPKLNQGLDFAYSEVIRKKDQRKCASGCTRPDCCGGKFAAMARFGIPTDSSGERMSDQEILAEYLGDDQASIIDGLCTKERGELLVQAKARVLSNRFGRHRHHYHRAGTPPGFWRTDMPGTQELEEDREEAQRMVREKVEERYREAMRPGGRWIFADEWSLQLPAE
ncbi:DNA repair protein endonuclease SAE2/CtIP C-terminus-domain-containing protein [Aspergillus egyptiacus]|nr:DNA repair protein endonuclease SAE2/CtIP C-terminus-domain-containing protein [Aspergillus egyptiacus]